MQPYPKADAFIGDQVTRVQRCDRGQFRKMHTTPEGFVFADVLATRAGVFEYHNSDGSVRRELRPEEEVFSPTSLGTLGRKPLTLNHPVDGDVPVNVTVDNYSTFSVGAVGDQVSEEEGGFVKVSVSILRKDAIESVTSGKTTELSCGYSCVLDMQAGEWHDGTGYDCIQRDIRYNHLALVGAGRAGPEVRIRGDAVLSPFSLPIAPVDTKWDVSGAKERVGENLAAFLRLDGEVLQVADMQDGRLCVVADAVFAAAKAVQHKPNKTKIRGALGKLYQRLASHYNDQSIKVPWRHDSRRNTMPQIMISGVSHEVTDAVAAGYAALHEKSELLKADSGEFGKKMKELEDKLADMSAKFADKSKEYDTLKGELDAMKSSSKSDEDDKQSEFVRLFNERKDVLEVAGRVGVEVTDKHDNSAIMRAVVEKATGTSTADKSNDYVSGAYSYVKARADKQPGLTTLAGGLLPPGNPPPEEKKFDAVIADARAEYLKNITGAAS
uniref:DUF2213 domain-containing protein n=1 Tax=viral metagenome TaxID=1070528 RepID=A0A6M3KZ41_9ZZZZ